MEQMDVVKQGLEAARAKVRAEIEALMAEETKINAALLALGGTVPPAVAVAVADLTKPMVGESAPTGKRRGRPRKDASNGMMTVRDAIVATITEAGKPITVQEIIAGASAKSGGAIATIRTQTNVLTKEGKIAQFPHAGRGFLYGPVGVEPPADPVVRTDIEEPTAPEVVTPDAAPVEPEVQAQ